MLRLLLLWIRNDLCNIADFILCVKMNKLKANLESCIILMYVFILLCYILSGKSY